MLVVELDGSQHERADDAAKDALRSKYLMSRGYQVFRVWNSEINTNIDGVLDGIYAIVAERCAQSPSSALRAPSPVSGEGKQF